MGSSDAFLPSMSPTFVQVNVGGVLFSAAGSTFMKSGYLAALQSMELGDDLRDDAGHLFIDRDPDLFSEVLRLLRGYKFNKHPRLSWEEVKHEADFYQLEELHAF